MVFDREKQAIKRATVRFVDFVKSLISRGAPVAAVDPAVTSEVAADPLLAEIDAMLAELLAQPSTLPVAEPEPERTPAPIVATTPAPTAEDLAAELELEALLASLDDDATTTPAAAKSSVNSDAGNDENPQAAPAFPADGAAGCPVVVLYPSTPFTTKPSKPSLQELIASIKASRSPLHDLFPKSAGRTFRLSPFIPSTTWSRSSQDQKDAHAIRTAQRHKAVAFSLNLSKKLEATLRSTPEPAKLLADYITRNMRAALGYTLPYAFQLEISPAGRLHAHGAACLKLGTQLELDQLGQAMRKAGGKVAPASRARQLSFDELYDAEGWLSYFAKTTAGTIAELGTSKIMHVSRQLNALAEQDWTARAMPALARLAA